MVFINDISSSYIRATCLSKYTEIIRSSDRGTRIHKTNADRRLSSSYLLVGRRVCWFHNQMSLSSPWRQAPHGHVRESCNPASAATGFVYKYDVSLAASDFEPFINDVKILLEDISRTSNLGHNLRCVNWGHIIGKPCVKLLISNLLAY